MNIIDTFLLDNTHEADLLVAKILSEQDLVSSWVIVQQKYNFKGREKPTILEGTIKAS